jgi:hypothetical protein
LLNPEFEAVGMSGYNGSGREITILNFGVKSKMVAADVRRLQLLRAGMDAERGISTADDVDG